MDKTETELTLREFFQGKARNDYQRRRFGEVSKKLAYMRRALTAMSLSPLLGVAVLMSPQPVKQKIDAFLSAPFSSGQNKLQP